MGITRGRIAAGVGLLAGAIWAYRAREALADIAMVFVFAGAFAALLSPAARWLCARGLSPTSAAGICVAGIILLLVLALSAFVPYLVSHSVELMRSLTPTVVDVLSRAGNWAAQHGWPSARQGGVAEMMAAVMSRATAKLASGSVAFAAQAGRMAFSLVICYYILCERDAVGRHMTLCLPMAWRTGVLAAIKSCKLALLGYISGMLKTSAFVTAATFLGLTVLGVRDALLLSLFMGVFEVLPYIGPVLAAVPIVLAALGQSWQQALFALGLVVLVQQIEGNFVSPHFAASSTSIHPMLALSSVFILGSLFGLWGIMLAIPAVVTARSLLWSLRREGIGLRTAFEG